MFFRFMQKLLISKNVTIVSEILGIILCLYVLISVQMNVLDYIYIERVKYTLVG